MRLDRAITLSLVHPLRSLGRHTVDSSEDSHLPILMYHSISEEPEVGVSPYYRVCTSPAQFAEQMACLAANGWRGVTLQEGLERIKATPTVRDETPRSGDLLRDSRTGHGIGRSCEKIVAITFDDGFRDFLTAAFPILQTHNFSATMYLPTGFISRAGDRFKGRECMDWNQIRELHRAGIEFGSHTVSHPKLVHLTPDEIEIELRQSRNAIEQELQTDVPSFAYPFAFPQTNEAFLSNLRASLANCGYQNCVTTIVGRASTTTDPFLLPRLPANSADDRRLLEAKLNGDYDWVGLAQKFRKKAFGGRKPQPSFRADSSVAPPLPT